MEKNKAADIDEYILRFPADIQKMLQAIRVTIQKAAPRATETIKYGMPTFVYNGNLVYFAAFKHHIGFFPAPTGDPAFRKDLAPYKTGKGSVQFPLDRPMPLRLITKIVKGRVAANVAKAKLKKV